MLKTIVIAAFLTCGAIGAHGQTAQPKPNRQPRRPSARFPPATSTSARLAASALIGAKVRNDNKETVGKIDDIYLDKDGNIKTVVMSVGGFLGVGSKAVAVKWSDIKFSRDDTSVVLTTALTKDALTAMPDYTKAEHRQSVPAETANAPPARPATAPGR